MTTKKVSAGNRLASSNGHHRRSEGEYACPECAAVGKERRFSRASALGQHRSLAHKIAGRRGPSKAPPPVWEKEGSRFVCSECKAAGKHATFAAPTALGLHRKMVHGIAGTSYAALTLRKLQARKRAKEMADKVGSALVPAAAAAPEVVEAPREKRAYTKRKGADAAPPFIAGNQHNINFCPNCRFDLRMLGMVLQMADKIQR